MPVMAAAANATAVTGHPMPVAQPIQVMLYYLLDVFSPYGIIIKHWSIPMLECLYGTLGLLTKYQQLTCTSIVRKGNHDKVGCSSNFHLYFTALV